MRKDKIWEVDLFDQKPFSQKSVKQFSDPEFWTSDTEAFLVFKLFNNVVPDSATLNLYNRDDKSLVVDLPMVINNQDVELELTDEIMVHFGRWSAQAVFNIAGESHTSPSISFTISRELGADLPERLGVIEEWKDLNSEVKSFVAEIEGFTLDQFVELKMGEELANLEVNYATRLVDLETNDASITAQLAQNVGFSIEDFPRLAIEIDDIPRFQRAVNFIPEGSRLIVPNAEYLFRFREGSTIDNPTRVVIDKDDVEIIGIGKPVIRMEDLTKEYLDSIDDYASSGRDIFTAFSFVGAKNSYIENFFFIGEHSGGHFRYQSPRSIAIAFKGTENAKAHNITGEGIMGNVINIVNSYINYDAPYAEAVNTSIADCMAINCLENGFNFMGGTSDSIATNLYAKGCANGLESASKNMIASDCIFDGNRGSAVGISGENITLNGVIGRNSIGEIGKDNGYGIIMTGGKNLVVNGGDFTGNKSNGLLVYPGCEGITINGADLSLSGEGNQYKNNINAVGTPEKKIKQLLINGCKINNNLAVLGNFNHTENAVSTANAGQTGAASSMIFNAQSTGSVAKNNNFNKPITMGDASGENHTNGNIRRVERGSIPTSGSWKLGDIVRNTNAGIGTWLEAICVQGGTFGASQEPIFKINLQNGHRGAVTTKPDFVGQTAQTLGSSPKFYIATGTASASDWQLIVG